eukprot:TRINITY_DN11903_c0_g1_i1.p1 TRINITY_DN11903_c0_g1~~TRINITY_DN11903_c0_g1_i1.p1  ORF type:complete len:307 (+),score=29.36 TRINITY_DN11903_c0_g1_i1:87-1007(+)
MSLPIELTSFVIDFTLGGGVAAAATSLIAPIERIRWIIRTQDANPMIRRGEVSRYTGVINSGMRLAQEQGIGRFWDGNIASCIRYGPTQAFNLAFKDAFKKVLPGYKRNTQFAQYFSVNLVAGGLAAACCQTIVYPFEYSRTRLAFDSGIGKNTFSGILDCMKKTASGPGGVSSLYTGFRVSSAFIVGYRGIQLGTFDTLMDSNSHKHNGGFFGIVSTVAAAQTATTVGAGAVHPFETARRCLQLQAETPVAEHRYKGTMDCLKRIAVDEGVFKGLYKGFLPTLARSVGSSFVLVFYDRAKMYLGL